MWHRLVLVLLAACTSTRQLANIRDPRLMTPGHREGFVVHTTERWHERIDPNTALRVHNAERGWSDQLHGDELFVDRAGVWIERVMPLSKLAEKVRITGITEEVAARLPKTKPDGADLDFDGSAWTLVATGKALDGWIADFVLAVARLSHDDSSVIIGCDANHQGCKELVGDDAKLYRLRTQPEVLGSWQTFTARRGWSAPLAGRVLREAIEGGRAGRVGWRWDDVDRIQVTNLSGGKTLGAIVGVSALAVAIAPIALLARVNPIGDGGGKVGGGPARFFGGGGGKAAPPGDWDPELASADSEAAHHLFSPWGRTRAIVRLTAALDGAAATRGDYIASGAIARVRFADIFEIGGGARVAESRRDGMWSRSTTGVFQVGLHLPLDAGFRVAIPLGFEAGAGGAIAHDLRFPWGLRYTAASGRWFATVNPATPSYMRLNHVADGRWSYAVGGELGASF